MEASFQGKNFVRTISPTFRFVSFILPNFSLFPSGSRSASKRSDHEVQSVYLERIPPVLFAIQLKIFRKYCNYEKYASELF